LFSSPTDTLTYFHSNQINTIGDIARATSIQIETYPIPPPKLTNIQKALEHFATSSSILPTNETTIIPIATTSEETIPESEAMITNSQDKLYDVDTLIDSLDYEKLYLNDEVPLSTNQTDFKRPRRQLALINHEEFSSPQKRCLSPSYDEQKSSHLTLGDRLQKAADIYKIKGRLLFDDDYIELIRELFHNSSLTHLEQLHLKTLFLNQ
jgi:hypothetical protein